MKIAGYVVLVFLAAALESVLPRVFFLDAARPLLVAILVVQFARDLGTVEGAALSVFAGFAEDATAGFPMGRAAFACVALFVGARLAFGGLRAEGRFLEIVLAALAAVFWRLAVTAVDRLLGPALTPFALGAWWRWAMWSALATAVCSPFVFHAARVVARLQKRAA